MKSFVSRALRISVAVLLVLVGALLGANRARAEDSCGGVSAVGGLLLTAMDVELSDTVVQAANAQLSAQHAFGGTARFELSRSSALGIRVEATRSSIGITQTPFNGGAPSSAGVGRVDMTQLLFGVVKHRRYGHRWCPYIGGALGLHHFSYRGVGSLGLTIAGLGGLDLAFAQHDSVFFELGLKRCSELL